MKKLKIGGNIYTVKTVNSGEIENDCGECATNKLLIRIADDVVEAAYAPTLLHEIIHAINISLDEKETEFMTQAIYQVLVDNPEFTKLFLKRRTL